MHNSCNRWQPVLLLLCAIILITAAVSTADTSTAYYAIACGRPGPGGSEIFDTSSRNFAIMNTVILNRLVKLDVSWKHAPVELERRLCIGMRQLPRDTAGFTDSLPYAAREFALTAGIKKVIVFHGYKSMRVQDTSKPTLGGMVTKILEQGTGDEEMLERTYFLNASVFDVTTNKRVFKTSAGSKERKERDYTGSKDGEVVGIVVMYEEIMERVAGGLERMGR